jgi:L-amino acid N-acyltransferase YncA
MTSVDREATLAFTRGLDHDDILFLQSDITKPEVVDEWIAHIERGRAIVILASDSTKKIVGYASLYRNDLSWSRHQGEVRLFVRKSLRGTGIGKHLSQEIARIAEKQNLELIVAKIPRDRPYLRAMFEKVGFTVEALLTDWLIDADGRTHDLIVMAKRVKDI